MIQLRDLLHEAVQTGATELRFSSQGSAEIRSRSASANWHALPYDNLGAHWTRENFLALLEQKEKQQLVDGHAVSGYLQVEQVQEKIHYTLARGEHGFYGHFQWNRGNLNLESFQLPALFFETLRKSSGLFLLSGPRLSGKSTLLKMLVQSESARQQAIAIFADQTEEFAGVDNRSVVFHTDQLASAHDLLTGFDLVVVDSRKPMAWKHALNAAETGGRVICTLPYVDLESAMERLSEKVESNREIGMARLASATQMALNVRMMEGLESARQPAVEILVLQRELREKIQAHQWSEVFAVMHKMGEKTGMRTLNQCLVNLMLKRKIDFKVGFGVSPNPEELDLMLERIGV